MEKAMVTPMDRHRSRPFGLGDAMIFIVALALGLALAGPGIIIIADAIRSAPRGQFRTMAGTIPLARFLNIVLLNFLFFLLPAFVIVRLRRPRAPLNSLICQPGFAACVAPIIFLLVSVPFSLLAPAELPEPIAIGAQVFLAAAGPLAWVCLIATRRWAPESGWIDRLGHILGLLWMVCIPTHLILIRLPF